MMILVPKPTHDAQMDYDVHQELIDGKLDCLFTSKYSIPSNDQPEHGGCTCTGITKWMTNSKTRSLMSEAYCKMGFTRLGKMSDAQVCMLFSLFSYCFINGEISCSIFQRILDNIDSFE